MNIIGIAIGITGLLLLCMFLWMLALSMRKKRLEQERKEREIAYRKAIEKNRKQEREERIYKAEGGHIPTILYLAKEAERTKPKEALYWYTKAAKLDNVTGMYGIVRISAKMKQDLILKEQSKFWQTCIAAIEGSLPHKFEMGVALFHGRGTEQDQFKAIQVMEAAAAQGYIDAMLFLGDWWISDSNSHVDATKSIEYYRVAAQLRSNEGRMKLGLSYINGLGVSADHAKGCYWLERAAEKGHLEAMYAAGEAWMDFRPNGSAIAYIWLFLASQLGYERAKGLRDRVALNIGVDTVVGLQGLSKPMMKKIRENKVGKHSIIKALNKLYKRDVPLLEQSVATNEQPMEASGEATSETLVESPKSEAVAEKVDFSQSPMDKH
jgi:TPR repeat protein